jgi:REP element-mobilizing transposase RayT
LLAAHIRTNHVHIVVTSESKPEPVMVAMKAYSSRALNQRGIDTPGLRRWARHGSTRYLWTTESIRAAIRYVVDEQGSAMAVYESPSPR